MLVGNTLIIRQINQLWERQNVAESSQPKPLLLEILYDTFNVPSSSPLQVETIRNESKSEASRKSSRERMQMICSQICFVYLVGILDSLTGTKWVMHSVSLIIIVIIDGLL